MTYFKPTTMTAKVAAALMLCAGTALAGGISMPSNTYRPPAPAGAPQGGATGGAPASGQGQPGAPGQARAGALPQHRDARGSDQNPADPANNAEQPGVAGGPGTQPPQGDNDTSKDPKKYPSRLRAMTRPGDKMTYGDGQPVPRRPSGLRVIAREDGLKVPARPDDDAGENAASTAPPAPNAPNTPNANTQPPANAAPRPGPRVTSVGGQDPEPAAAPAAPAPAPRRGAAPGPGRK